jgi:uroporphyrin-III C-methyltransferase
VTENNTHSNSLSAVPQHVQRSTLIWLSLLVLFIAIVAGMSFVYRQYVLQQDILANMEEQLENKMAALSLEHEVLEKEVEQQLVNQQTQVQQGLDEMASRVDSNATKLMALSSVNRDDWKLAEINYLLRMADYRVLMEKDNVNALALAMSADEILASLDQTGLQQIRKILAEEIAVMKMAGRVDREGLYMQISALANQIDAIPFVQPLAEVIEPETIEAEGEQKTLKEKTKDFFYGIWLKLKPDLRVHNHGKEINAILPPAEQIYLRQNLRLMMEQAQAALLRGEGEIYKDSLVKAQNWINQYYQLNQQSKIILDEIRLLAQENIAPEYNNFENSRSALNEYIARQQKAAVRRGVR